MTVLEALNEMAIALANEGAWDTVRIEVTPHDAQAFGELNERWRRTPVTYLSGPTHVPMTKSPFRIPIGPGEKLVVNAGPITFEVVVRG